MPTRIAYLGPGGTYGEQASRALAELEGLTEVSFLPCAGLRAVVECLAQAGADAAGVPVANPVEGGATATLDALWAHSDRGIRRALVLPIRHALLGPMASRPVEPLPIWKGFRR